MSFYLKVRLIFLLSNRMTSGIHALDEVNEVRKINAYNDNMSYNYLVIYQTVFSPES